MANLKKGGLGRGLGALIPNPPKTAPAPAVESVAAPVEETGDRLLQLNPHDLRPNPKQPRTYFAEDALDELAESIRRDGVQEPVIVRKQGDVYELISGERRVRASIIAGLEKVPAVCREVSDQDMLKLGIIENIQRENLNAIELAKAYQQLQNEFSWTQEQLADEVGKKRATVANTLRLLNLPDDVQARVADESITMGHARALLALPTEDEIRAACRKIIAEGLSVRETEKLAAPAAPREEKKPTPPDPNLRDLEDRLRRSLGTKVKVRTQGQKGKIEIEYFSLDELDRLLSVIGA